MSFKEHFSRFLGAAPGRLHFAAHSHHGWPDASLGGQQRAWEDAVRLADRKWELVFGELLPRCRGAIAAILGLSDPEAIALGANTHEFVVRVLSCLEDRAPVRVLTTDGEFHSFARQAARLEEAGRADVRRVPLEPFEDFPQRFLGEVAAGGYDLLFFSHVFFNSGYVFPELAEAVRAVPADEAFVVIDGYHGFCAVPTDLAAVEDRAFYLAGGYKYAMAGEGACFLHCPPGYGARPVNTGWFAGFGQIAEAKGERVSYGTDGSRFAGSTFDPTAFYRFDAVQAWWHEAGLAVADLHAHARGLQERFLDRLARRPAGDVSVERLLPPRGFGERGHFLTFRTADAGTICARLGQEGVVTDYRADRLRFGFGPYHDEEDVDALHGRLVGLLA